jgi:energy-coupling factor transporter ATP-binding protein EcfA2
MTSINFPRGSEWRRWDLQIHTPFSTLKNGFGSSFEAYAKGLFEMAVANRIAVIGVTDYFCIEGYKALRFLAQDEARFRALLGDALAVEARKILLLPNIELRTGVVIARAGKENARVNFHVVMSDQVPPETIDDHFLRELKFTCQSSPESPDERWSLTLPNLSALGKKLKDQHPKFAGKSDLFVGMMNAVVQHEDVTKVLVNQPSRFKDRHLLVTPADEDLSECSWDGQAHLTRKLYYQKSHMFFSSNANTREFGLGRKHASVADFKKEFQTLKACVHGSDAHSFEELFEPAGRRYCWIKANPKFEGLVQVCHEPDGRAFIGLLPPSLERSAAHATKIVDSVRLERAAGAHTSEKWFSGDVLLNSDLVVIIGNKGSGKSALADVLGLLGNTPRHTSFGFLNTRRFRDPKNNKAKHFQASLTWADGSGEGPARLDSTPEPGAVEKVKYVPQNYLEEICNEVGLGKGSRFYAELQQAIFSHVDDAERGTFETLDALLEHRGDEIRKGIRHIVGELSTINRAIAEQEELQSPKHRKNLELQLMEKRREASAHEQAKPNTPVKPEDDPETQQLSLRVSGDLAAKQAAVTAVEKAIAEFRSEDAQWAKKQMAGERLATKLANLRRQVESGVADAATDLAELGLTRENVLTFETRTAPVEEVLAKVMAQRKAIAARLDPKTSGGEAASRVVLLKEIEGLQDSLSAPARAYQEHLRALKAWEGVRVAIAGSPSQPGTVMFLEKSLSLLDEVPGKIRTLAKTRRRKALEILRDKQRLQSYYRDYYGSVQRFLAEHPLATSDAFKVTFTVTMVETGFADGFLGKINRRKHGAFAGVEDGAAALKRLMDETDWNSTLSVTRFVGKVVNLLKGTGADRSVSDQLVQGESPEALYDFLFSFDYVQPIYRLAWDGKGLEQLSPGERGNLLLIFYLLVDRAEIPLVIDQPEENLDNQTIVRTLVPCIKDAKNRRQIVLVTHNPNLAVVCDADQIIYAEIAKDRRNEVTYRSGAIEDPVMNPKVVDVLEGTRPAFDQRDARYQP